MKLRNRWLIRLAAGAASLVLRIWLGTVRTRIKSADGRTHPADPAVERFIYAFWHESLLAPAKIRTKVRIMISQSADGEFIAQVCRHLGVGVVRGSSSRDGARGLLDMLREDGASHLALTPDGPRGPRRRVQAGVVMLASCTGLPLVPVGVGFTGAWRARSWDRFAIPFPFTTMLGVLGEPIRIAPQLDRAGLQRCRAQVETALLEATQAAESWAAQLTARRSVRCVGRSASGPDRAAVPPC